MAKVRRTYADLLGADPVPLLPDGTCAFCQHSYKDNSRVGKPDVHGGVRRYHVGAKGLACDPCIEKFSTKPLPAYRKIVELEEAWAKDAAHVASA